MSDLHGITHESEGEKMTQFVGAIAPGLNTVYGCINRFGVKGRFLQQLPMSTLREYG